MTDAELTAYLGLTPEEGELSRAKDPDGWERYRRVATVFQDVELWDKGLGPLPPGVIACGPKQVRGAR